MVGLLVIVGVLLVSVYEIVVLLIVYSCGLRNSGRCICCTCLIGSLCWSLLFGEFVLLLMFVEWLIELVW